MNDAELAAAIAKLRGEWIARGRGELTVAEIPIEQARAEIDADLLVFPSCYLGDLCEAERLRPMRANILQGKELDFEDILPLVREREIVFAQQVMALPLGCPVPLQAAVREKTQSFGAPLAGHYAAFVFMARAAPLAAHPSRESIWFDPETMKPRLMEPPFVRALTEMVAIGNGVDTPCKIAHRLEQSDIDSATVWPCRSNEVNGLARLRVEMLSAATQRYNPSAAQWETMPPTQVTLLASSGRLIGVSTKSRNSTSAFRLAGWLASPDVVNQLVRESNGLAICRSSQRRVPDNWLGKNNSAEDRQFSEQLFNALTQREAVPVPRLPEVDRYLDALADAVRLAADGKTPPTEALETATAAWESITEEMGRDKQRQAYRRCLGIEP